MSYILEALKKAQAERQLGSAPDIHAPAPSHVPVAATRASRAPLLVGLSAGIAIAAVAGVLVWRAQAPASAPAAVLAANGPAQGGAAVPAAVPTPPAQAVTPAPLPAPARESVTAAPVPAPASEAVEAAPVRAPAPNAVTPARPPGTAAAAPAPAAPARKPAQPEPAAAPAVVPATPAAASPEAVYLPAPARAADPAPLARAPEPVDDNLRTLQQLPEALQREVPRVSVGGYIYSPNPSDRLLLVDKTLRREGEELAPGLVLERLMPKYAVMNYRGTRYRVAY